MSLSNPNKPVTEQRLAEFYQGILPYLGGMPEMLANKFSKGDIYSTDEKIVGTWIDGKPLYQKTVVDDITDNSNYSFGTNITIVNASVFGLRNNTWFSPFYLSSSDYFQAIVQEDNAYIKFAGNTYSKILATIQYTKTTDSAISIGSETDYSTTEKIVGTWIDGKPIYQKTVNIGNLPNKTTKVINHEISDMDLLINAYGVAKNNNDYTVIPFVHDTEFKNVAMWISTTSIEIGSRGIDNSGSTGYVTLQYTKTTD